MTSKIVHIVRGFRCRYCRLTFSEWIDYVGHMKFNHGVGD